MTDKILEAVKALGGDLGNTYANMRGDEEALFLCDDGDYLADTMESFNIAGSLCGATYICTILEFNTYAAEWLKEAYMHNAAIDLGWDIEENPRWVPTVCSTRICTKEELVAYMDANKPKPAFTQAMADAGELPPVGCECRVKHKDAAKDWAKPDFHETTVVAYGEELVIFNDGVSVNGGFESVGKISDYLFKPIKSPREKAIEEMFAECYPNKKPSELLSIAIGKLYDAGYRKLTPEQRKEFGL